MAPTFAESKKIAENIEFNIISGLTLRLNHLWPALSAEDRVAYRHLEPKRRPLWRRFENDPKKIIEAHNLDEDEVLALMWGMHFHVDVEGGEQIDTKSLDRHEARELFKHLSLLRCKLGVPGAVADSHRQYIELLRNLEELRELRTKQIQEMNDQPDQYEGLIARRLFEIDAFDRGGGDKAEVLRRYGEIGGPPSVQMDLLQRARWHVSEELKGVELAIAEIDQALGQLRAGESRSIKLLLTRWEEQLVPLNVDDPTVVPDWICTRDNIQEPNPRRGVLSKFVRGPDAYQEHNVIAREVVHCALLLPQALLAAFDPTVSTARN